MRLHMQTVQFLKIEVISLIVYLSLRALYCYSIWIHPNMVDDATTTIYWRKWCVNELPKSVWYLNWNCLHVALLLCTIQRKCIFYILMCHYSTIAIYSRSILLRLSHILLLPSKNLFLVEFILGFGTLKVHMFRLYTNYRNIQI